MPDWTQLATMLPSVVAGLKGSGAETAAFMEGYNRTTQMLKQQQMQQQSIDEAGRRTDMAGAEQTYQHGQDALRNRTSALDTLLGALPGLASTAGPSVTGTTSMETPIGSIGVPTVQGPEQNMMAQVQSLADMLDQPGLGAQLAPMVRPALTRAEAARVNQRRRAYADAIELADKRSGVSSEEQVQAGTLITVTLPNGTTARVPYEEALRVSGMPPVKAGKDEKNGLTGEFNNRYQVLLSQWKVAHPDAPVTPAVDAQLKADAQKASDAVVTGGTSNIFKPMQEFQVSERLASAWRTASQPVRDMRRAKALMDVGLQRFKAGDKNGGSQAILVTFQKVLDPTSVVRESEYARSASGVSLLSQMEGYVERLKAGGAGVPAGDLEKMVGTASGLLEALQENAEGTRTRILTQARKYNIDPATIFDDTAPAPPAASPVVQEWEMIGGKLVPKKKGG